MGTTVRTSAAARPIPRLTWWTRVHHVDQPGVVATLAATMATTPSALITGVGGQDGIYLARHSRGPRLPRRRHGPTRCRWHPRRSSRPTSTGSTWSSSTSATAPASPDCWTTCSPTRSTTSPASPRSGASWGHAEVVAETNAMAVLRILESLVALSRAARRAPRFFQPSSSEMFGTADQHAADREHPAPPAQPVRGEQELRPPPHGQLPRVLRAVHHDRHALQPREPAARAAVRDPQDLALGRRDRARASRVADPRQPRRAPRLGVRRRLRARDARHDAAGRPAGLHHRHRRVALAVLPAGGGLRRRGLR